MKTGFKLQNSNEVNIEMIDPNYLDEETKRRISDSINKNRSGDMSHVVEILRIDREESVFYVL